MPVRDKLTAVAVQRQKKPGRYGDGGGLWLQVAASGAKSWIFRYARDGRARHMGLGAIEIVSLAEARDIAREKRRLLLDGIDPIQARKDARASTRAAAARGITFRECADQLVASQEV